MSAEELETELRYARSAIWTVAQMGGESAKLLMQYIGWFAPPDGKLSFEQIAAHLAAVQAMFNDSTAAEWKAALRQMLADKVSGSLKMPLTNHLPLEDYLTAARAQQAHRQPENAFEADAPSRKQQLSRWHAVNPKVHSAACGQSAQRGTKGTRT